MRPLILTGGPAVGKTTCGRALAVVRDRVASIDVNDKRRLMAAEPRRCAWKLSRVRYWEHDRLLRSGPLCLLIEHDLTQPRQSFVPARPNLGNPF